MTSEQPAPPAVPTPPPGAPRSRPLWVYIGGLVAVLVVGVIVIKALEPAPPEPPCNPILDVCVDPPPGGDDPVPTSGPQPTREPGQTNPPPEPGVTPVPYVGGTTWSSSDLGFQIVYDPDDWVVVEEGATFLVLGTADEVGAWAIFDGRLASEETVESMIEEELGFYTDYTSIEEDDDPYKAIVGGHIAYLDGVGRSYVATGRGADGLPLDPRGLGIIAATDGRIVVAFVMEVVDPDQLWNLANRSRTRELVLRTRGDELLKDFRWGP